MTDTSGDFSDADIERTLEVLGEAVDPRLLEMGIGAFAWRSIDEDLAELLTAAPVSLRSEATTQTAHRFSGTDLVVSVGVEPTSATRATVDVVIDGPTPDLVTLHGPTGVVDETDEIDFGTVHFENVARGLIRVGFLSGDRTVMTPWIST